MRALTLFNNRRPQTVQDLMEEFMKDFDRNLFTSAASPWRADGGAFNPHIDVEEKDGVYYVTADLPGVKKDEIKLDLHDNVFTISGERVKEIKGENKHTERVWGKFSRSFTLPIPVDDEKIEARFEDGVLHVAIPQKEMKKTKTIKIN
ncbi:MAG: Hsp20/alpha crystallin family protein [Bdellovibrionia bacterium]